MPSVPSYFQPVSKSSCRKIFAAYFFKSLNACFHVPMRMPYVIQSMAIGSRYRAPSIPPMSTDDQPKSPSIFCLLIIPADEHIGNTFFKVRLIHICVANGIPCFHNMRIRKPTLNRLAPGIGVSENKRRRAALRKMQRVRNVYDNFPGKILPPGLPDDIFRGSSFPVDGKDDKFAEFCCFAKTSDICVLRIVSKPCLELGFIRMSRAYHCFIPEFHKTAPKRSADVSGT